MSFSSLAKEELLRSRKKYAAGERQALLIALINTAGSLTLRSGGGLGVRFLTENYALGRFIAKLVTGMYAVEAQTVLREQERLRSRATLVLVEGEGVKRLLADTGVLRGGEEGPEFAGPPPMEEVATPAQKKAFLKGAFLGGGSVSNPKRAYHLEFVCNTQAFSGALAALLREFDLPAKALRRKERYVVYLKDADAISALLTLLGAPGSTLEFEDARVVKNVRNYINRTNNCETANMGKTARASVQQREEILYIKRERGLESLPRPLRLAAEVRLNHPEASLQELAQMLEVSRSGMNHRLARLSAIAHELQRQKGER